MYFIGRLVNAVSNEVNDSVMAFKSDKVLRMVVYLITVVLLVDVALVTL